MSDIRFRIPYTTRWGERLRLNLTHCATGETEHVEMQSEDGHTWIAVHSLPYSAEGVRYEYCVTDEHGGTVRTEARGTRFLQPGRRSQMLVCDTWTEREIPVPLLRSAFTECVFRRQGGAPARMELIESPYLLLVRTPPPPAGCRWGISGNSPALGGWKEEKIRFLKRTGVYEWGTELSAADFKEGMEYKYVLVDTEEPGRIRWETGENRCLPPQELAPGETAVRTDDAPRIKTAPWRGAGVVIPVFSLRSRGSFGIGDFGDLQRFIVWAARTGMNVVQLLPINDTTSSGTWHDSYPYSAISVFALHPIYLDLREWAQTDAYKRHEERGWELNALPRLDYEAVFAEKMAFLHELYGEIGKRVTSRKEYKDFVRDNQDWLPHYTGYLRRKAQAQGRAEAPQTFYPFVQYLLHRQMSAAHEKARSLGVILKGDIPIGICRDSVPAEVDTRLFHFDGQAGAPPDDFAVNGQNWGFPTYNWEEMSKDGYAWWKRRFAHMKRYFDAYRIDHVLGFFRIWEIPSTQAYGVMGHFRPALPLSADEIRGFGFSDDIGRYTRAFVTPHRFNEMEEDMGGHGLRRFFDEQPDGTFTLKPEFSTQRQILSAVGEGKTRDLLMKTVTEVLFLNDNERPDLYHPRVTAQHTDVFNLLSETDKAAFNRLYDHFFYFRHNEYWAEKAIRKLSAIIDETEDASPMLPCAEDLGMVPASVKGVLGQLNILSLEIQRMPKEYGVRFGNPAGYPYLSVTTIATHDMAPLRLWWREDKERTQAFWKEVLHLDGQAPEEASSEICEEVLTLHLNSSSMLCIIALQDLLAIDPSLRHPHPEEEQINDPANPDQYWQYRMHLTVEDLEAATGFNEKLRSLLERCGR